MKNDTPTDSPVTGSATDNPLAGDLPPLPMESVAHRQRAPSGTRFSPVEAFQECLDGMADDVLKKTVVDLYRTINAAHAQAGVAIRELEQRDIPENDDCLSTAGWLATHCQMTRMEASGAVKTARAMVHMPTVTANALSGSVPRRSAHLLAQTRDRHPDEFRDSEGTFGVIAAELPVADLRRAIEEWEQEVNYPKALLIVENHDEIRWLHLTHWVDGTGNIEGVLPPDLLHVVSTVIDAKINPTFLDPEDQRTPGQRRADALGDVCQFYLDHNDDIVTSGGEKPHITITLDYETLKERTGTLPEIAGMPVTPETVRRIACDAGIIPMILGSDSKPLDVGRKTRTIPTAIRRALDRRDGGCTWTGCTAPLSWCDAHHIIHWADGGETTLGNLRLLCRKHHTATHNGKQPPPDT